MTVAAKARGEGEGRGVGDGRAAEGAEGPAAILAVTEACRRMRASIRARSLCAVGPRGRWMRSGTRYSRLSVPEAL
jgi:hypothetical protein